ncbi:MAG TPA: DUF547 domain-containing protein [Thermoanaerobaculia bacterium]|nr:DUF547 domain-containing protein [Thermoanaerobaculia bacterium]
MKTRIAGALALAVLAGATRLRAAIPDAAPFDAVLSERAKNGGFDYAGTTGQDRKRLAAYLTNLGDAQPETMTPEEKKAFYINAYNALAIQTLLDHPGRSIRDISGAFNRSRWKVGGEMLTLDDVENRLRDMKDSRIHFAIVCASRSCPPLAPRAYTAAGVEVALEKQGRAFVNDPSRNVIDRVKGRIALSKIFHWNRREFERDGGGSLLKFVSRFASDPATASYVATFPNDPEFLDYDWSPNQP